VTPLDDGSPDLFLSCSGALGGSSMDPLPINNRQPPGLSSPRYYSQSINPTGPDSVATNASDPLFSFSYWQAQVSPSLPATG
jgi:hypothetical protein